ncbi:MAG: glycosyltransferase [Candidatus Micrarchaeia archaeon]
MITIAITAFKEERTIGRAIKAILNQKIKEKYELLIVAPDIETLNAAKKYREKHSQIKLIKDAGEGKPAALNLIFKKARGRILVLTDGDVFVGKNAISELLNGFTSPKVGAVSGRVISLNSRDNMLGYWSHLLVDAAHKERMKRMKRKQFLECSGYLYAIRNVVKKIPKEALSEDALISHIIAKKGYLINYAPKACVYVKFPTTFTDWIKQKKRSAGGYLQIRRLIKGKENQMRTFLKEAIHFWFPFKYAKNLKETFWSLILLFARAYLWILIFIDVKIKRKKLKQIWLRVETTK